MKPFGCKYMCNYSVSQFFFSRKKFEEVYIVFFVEGFQRLSWPTIFSLIYFRVLLVWGRAPVFFRRCNAMLMTQDAKVFAW